MTKDTTRPGRTSEDDATPRTRGKGRPTSYAKSDAVRIHILETAITCLAESPYSEVSASVIADRAQVSRGGMQYHFPTRLALLQATLEHLQSRRLALFRADMQALPPGEDVAERLVDTHWRHLNEREFRAYQELVLAGRSEPEMARMLAEQYGGFLHEWLEIGRTTFGWDYADPQVARAGNVAHYLMEGMAFGGLGGQLTPETTDDLLSYAKNMLRAAMRHQTKLASADIPASQNAVIE